MHSFKSMENKLKKFLSMPNNSLKDQAVNWLLKKCLSYNLFIICSSILLLSIIYIISPSLINYFSIVLTIFLILGLNATYFLYIMVIALLFKSSTKDIANNYLIRNSFIINLIFSAAILILFSLVLIILKFL